MSTLTFPELTEVEGKIADRQKQLSSIFEQAQDGGEGTLDMSKIKGLDNPVEEIRKLNDELTELGKERTKLQGVLDAARGVDNQSAGNSQGTPEPAAQRKSAGQIMAASSALKNRGTKAEVDISLKTLFQTSAGWAPESTRSGLVVPDAQRPVQVTDLLPSIPTGQAAYKYMEETTFTNNAAERSEGGAYGEAALALTERSVTIESIGVFIPVTDEQLEDEEGAAAYLDARLPFMVRQRMDGQILTGDGNTPNILGINNKASVQTQAKGTDPTPDAIHKGITKARVTGRAMPNAVVFHPNDWQDIRLLRTSDGVYIWGNPSEAGPERIWGLQVVQSDAQTENTAVVGDFANYSLLVVRRGMEVKVSDSHSDYFVNGKQAIRAGLRVATVWTRAEAFCKVTGI